ncbi:MAG: methyltransferase [Sulfolobaceae archaeon]|nr:methyltransferase [Sulfolobaceae archaeon]
MNNPKPLVIATVVNGIPLTFLSKSGLFSKGRLDEGTRVLLENLILPEQGNVIDVGCGYGPIGIYIAKIKPQLKVYMVDINPEAVKTTRTNVKLNNVEDRVIVLKSDMFSDVPKDITFKGIYSNPPLSKGREFIEKLISEAYERLEINGIIELVVYKGEEIALDLLRKTFSNAKLLKRSKGYNVVMAVKV